MNRLAFLFCFTLCLLLQTSVAQTSNCYGRRRWDVKTLTDRATKKINFSPVDTTIAALIKVQPSEKITQHTPRFGIEYRTFTLHCFIKEIARKKDGDYHLTLMDENDTTKIMVAEIPDPMCGAAVKSPYVSNFIKARNFVDSLKTDYRHIQSGLYTVMGVAFFDKVHETFEVASNGIEIHPILFIVKD